MRIITNNLYLEKGLFSLVSDFYDENIHQRIVFIDTGSYSNLTAYDFSGFVIYITPGEYSPGWRELFCEKVKYGEVIHMKMTLDEIKQKVNSIIDGENIKVNVPSEYKLTEKEIYIIQSLAKGVPTQRCALVMKKDIKTISNHKRKAMKKLGLKTDQELRHTVNALQRFSDAIRRFW